MDVSLIWLTVAALAVWRVTHLLVWEAGPGAIIERLRSSSDTGFWRSLWTCFYCMSLWVALPAGLSFAAGWVERLLIWLALSGAACLLERMGQPDGAEPATYFEGNLEEENHELLRRREPGNQSSHP